jgi:hypothetical protein
MLLLKRLNVFKNIKKYCASKYLRFYCASICLHNKKIRRDTTIRSTQVYAKVVEQRLSEDMQNLKKRMANQYCQFK